MDDRIIKSFLSHCRAFSMPTAWKAMASDKFAYVAPTSLEECARKMLADHAEHELVEAGIFRRIEGALRWHPGLAIPDATLIALTDPKSSRIFEIVTDLGCITSDLIPPLLMPDDQFTQAAFSSSSRTLHVTETVKDCVLLRSLGLAAAPAGDFTTLNNRGLQLLCKFFEINVPFAGDCVADSEPMPNGYQVARRRMEDYHKLGDRIGLVLVNWSPSGFSFAITQRIDSAIQFLQKLDAFLGCSIYDVGIWSPTPNHRNALAFAASRCQPAWIKHTLLESLRWDVQTIETSEREPPIARQAEVLDTVMRLFSEIPDDDMQGSPQQTRREAWKALKKISFDKIQQPLFAQALATKDPVERSARFVFARLCMQFDSKLRAVEKRVFVDGRPLDPLDKSISELLPMIRQLATLRKEFFQWEHRRSISPAPRSLKLMSISHFAPSDSASGN